MYENNKVLEAMEMEPINLKSVMIGNGITDPVGCVSSTRDGKLDEYSCAHKGWSQLTTISNARPLRLMFLSKTSRRVSV